MSGGKIRAVGWIVVSCCLAAVCAGCGGVYQHGCLVRGGRLLESNRVPWRSSAPAEPCVADGTGCEEGCAAPPGTETALPAAVPDIFGPDQTSCAATCDPMPCAMGLFRPFARLRALRTHEQATEPVVQLGDGSYPRLHPVPTRPVFLPNSAGMVLPVSAATGAETPDAAAPSAAPPPPLKLNPPPVPEEIRAPRPDPSNTDSRTDSAPTEDRVTEAPRRLRIGGSSAGWIFRGPGLPAPSAPLEAKTTPKAAPLEAESSPRDHSVRR